MKLIEVQNQNSGAKQSLSNAARLSEIDDFNMKMSLSREIVGKIYLKEIKWRLKESLMVHLSGDLAPDDRRLIPLTKDFFFWLCSESPKNTKSERRRLKSENLKTAKRVLLEQAILQLAQSGNHIDSAYSKKIKEKMAKKVGLSRKEAILFSNYLLDEIMSAKSIAKKASCWLQKASQSRLSIGHHIFAENSNSDFNNKFEFGR